MSDFYKPIPRFIHDETCKVGQYVLNISLRPIGSSIMLEAHAWHNAYKDGEIDSAVNKSLADVEREIDVACMDLKHHAMDFARQELRRQVIDGLEQYKRALTTVGVKFLTGDTP